MATSAGDKHLACPLATKHIIYFTTSTRQKADIGTICHYVLFHNDRKKQ
ncbi:hypothetical protein N476_06240 [Pseudoalteromonas luteoviolacea H33]|uniref:Uncharacterized protein n=1 Tax=Pseudoalteromonas luteoviolacea H33 TaxID=1365251 RepID=A0A166ZRW2_9GAMM|nr:hypothetical protein N476_06240 [Pseudoalteromonas luteoviolacea H33]KZN75398.1 hypothetical protein N477_19250 [Pseudoalteromonas luteoviolacea H33-S]